MKQAGLTLHQHILSDIEGRILSGKWRPGHRIPSEMELLAQYQCSRMTVNKVLTQLANEGLIQRRRKTGSVVAQARAHSAILDIHDIKTEVQSLKLPYTYELLKNLRRKLARHEKSLLNLRTGSAVRELAALHYAGPHPFCLEQRIINIAAIPHVEEADFATEPPGHWLIAQVPWSTAEHEINAVAATAHLADVLKIAKGSACLVVERRTWRNAEPITHVRLTYPGDRHTLVARFSPNGRSA